MDASDNPFVQSPASRTRRTPDLLPADHLSSHQKAPLLADPFKHEEPSTASGSQESSGSADIVVGQFSFAPAIKKTVVTTTTTTTTTFPPIVMRAPQQLHDLDLKLYPLAASPTPPSMRKLYFNIGGRRTIFSEAEDPLGTLDEYEQQNKRLRSSREIVQSSSDDNSTSRGGSSRSRPVASADHFAIKEETSPPPSISSRNDRTPPGGNVKTRSSQRMLGRQRRVSGRQASLGQNEVPRLHRSSSKLQIVQTSTPVTPHVGLRGVDVSEASANVDANREMGTVSPFQEELDGAARGRPVAQTLSPQPESSLRRPRSRGTNDEAELQQNVLIQTPPVDSQSSTDTYSSRPRPTALDTTAIHDASLPSPSLSPVTAAANLQARNGNSYFEQPSQQRRVETGNEKHNRRVTAGLGLWQDEDSKSTTAYDYDGKNPKFSMTDLPDMVDAFDAMPTDMKSYMMYQLLRRCPKPSLRFIADVVNPALKCDFLTLLPPELSQLVISHLDLKSLCRAAQVSRKWRQVIDADEKVWKELFDKEGFTLAPGELRRAILEGWGWQHCSSISDAEQNLGNFESFSDNSLEVFAQSPSSERSPSQSENRRYKRKAGGKHRAASRKVQKRRATPSKELATFDTEALQKHLSSAEGPFAAARVAKLAIPHAEQGLPQLRSMTLHKSIYRRHHLIGQNWMQNEVKPRHIAFSAHANHVVTCLEFDSDKIITGSDDTNINVYDTHSGALRATLAGHEGGVWALKYEGNMLVSGSTDRSVRIWDIKKGECVHVFHGHTSTVRCLLIVMPTQIGKTSDGRPIIMPKEPIIVTGSRDSTLRVWRLPMPDDEPTFSPGTAQAQGTTNPTVPVGPAASAADEVESPYFVRTLAGHGHSVRAIAAHGDTLVSGSYDFSVRVWRISTGETLHRLTGHSQKVYSVVLDHERGHCISGSMDNLVKIWSLETGQCLHNLDGHSSLVGLLDLQRDRLVSAAADFTLRIWDPANGHCRSVLNAHTGAITCFQHDGHKVISGSDRNLKMWDVRTGEFVRDLLTDLTGVWQVKFDEHRCVAAVQRDQLTYLEILDFSASRDGLSTGQRGRRIVVNTEGEEISDNEAAGEAIADAIVETVS